MGRGAAPHPPGAASPLVLSLHKLQSQDGVGRAGRPLLCLHSWHQTYFYYGGRHHPPLGTGSEQQSFFLQNLPNHCYDQNKMTIDHAWVEVSFACMSFGFVLWDFYRTRVRSLVMLVTN